MATAVDAPIRRARTDLMSTRRVEGEQVAYVVHDPVRGAYFQLGEDAFHVLELLDGRRTPADVSREFLVRHEADLPTDLLPQFVSQLEKLGLLEVPPEEASSPFRRAAPRPGLFSQLLFLRVRTVDPQRYLNAVHRCVGPLFSGWALFAALASVATAIAVLSEGWADLWSQAAALYRPASIATLWVAFLGVILVHETAHGVTCVHFGGRVREMGFLLIYLMPGCYTDVSAAWMFPKRSQRLWVSLAGVIAEGFLWSVCVFLWRLATPESLLHNVCRSVILLSGVGILFNLNPLIKLDGYYALSDALALPNLRSRSMSHLGRAAWALLTGFRVSAPSATQRERRIFLVYGLLALVYTALLLGAILLGLGGSLVEHLGGVGGALFAWFAFALLSPSVWRFGSGIRAMADETGKRQSLRRPLLLLALAASAAGVAWLIPMQLKVTGPFVLAAAERGHARVPLPGLVLEVLVAEGDRVKAGDPVARLDSTPFELERAKAAAALERAKADLALLEAGPRPEEIARAESKVAVARMKAEAAAKSLERNQDLHKRGMLSLELLEAAERAHDVAVSEQAQTESEVALLKAGSRKEEVDGARAKVREAEHALAQAEYRLSRTTMKAPIAGTVVTQDPGALAGKYVEAGIEVCEIAVLDRLVAEIEVPEKELADVKRGARVSLKAASLPGETFGGEAGSLAPVLDERGGIRIARVRCVVTDPDGRLRPGMTGEARIDCGERRSLSIFGRKLIRLLRIEFW